MSARVACLWVPWFAAAAAARAEPALADRPLVVVRGVPPATRVIEAGAAARERGVRPGMTETEARARCAGLESRPWREEPIASARHALLEAALAVSPRVEDAGPGLVHVDLAGLGRLFGDDAAIAARLARLARGVGLPGRVAVAGTRIAARVVARTAPGALAVVPPGGDRTALAGAGVEALDLPADLVATLARWGVTTLGGLAGLPRAGLAARLGPAGLAAHDAARGRDGGPFRPWSPPPFWEEAQGLDWEIDDLEALTAVLGSVLERLAARLATAHVWAEALDLGLELATGARHERGIVLAHPTREPALLRMLVRHDLAVHPPAAAVTGVAVSVRAVRAEAGQGGLWSPPAPPGRDLAALVARLTALVGGDNLGSPALGDSHRPDDVALVPFAPPGDDPPPATVPDDDPAPALRRLRPPCPVQVTTGRDERPAAVRRGDRASRVVTCAGPWRASGEWWDTRGWWRDEWDALLDDGTLCRLAHEPLARRWLLDGIYD